MKLGKNLQVVQKVQHRSVFDVPKVEAMPRDDDEGVISNDEAYQQNESCIIDGIVQVEVHELGPLNRDDVDSNRINTSDVDNEGVDDANSEESDGQDDTLDDYCTDEEENMCADDDAIQTFVGGVVLRRTPSQTSDLSLEEWFFVRGRVQRRSDLRQR
ncbi:unnamed protein product [Ilex paraguariensis]|uniref:Uncharacterized protein n=1 Tax=Ilex paraguariensis TaxID=185542 RepID=A0ABC8SY08_9AQUA